MKYSRYIGVLAVIVLIGSCFFPWTFYPDIEKTFTGFFSEGNYYGKPGKLLTALGVIAMILFLVPAVWAKRFNMFTGALMVAFGVKTYILFTGCYRGTCPEKKTGIFIMVTAALVVMLMTVLPDTRLKNDAENEAG